MLVRAFSCEGLYGLGAPRLAIYVHGLCLA